MNNPIHKVFTLLVVLLLLSHSGVAQNFAIGSTTLTFNDPSRSGRSIETAIYYPADVAGQGVPVAISGAAKYPVIVFGHGFVMSYTAYANIWEALVPKGFILAFPKTETGLLPSHLDFGKDLALVTLQMQ